MVSTRKLWVILLAVGAALAPSFVAAQDFPTMGGNNGRTGKNNNPLLYTPGIGNLVWFWPNGNGRQPTLVRDNNSNATARVPSFDPANPSLGPALGFWGVPDFDQEAGFAFYPSRTPANPALDAVIGAKGFDQLRGGRAAGYEYTRTVASALGSHLDPTVPYPNRAYFEWTVDPTQENPTTPNGNYQLFAYIPNGPTGPVPGIGGTIYYPNRYYVFEILYGNGLRWIDVVDTNVAGQGWVRLGNGGQPTNNVFPYTGTPIRIRLYNAQWRDEFNNILEDNSVPRAVYADAVMAVPDNGYTTAGPVVSQINLGLGTRTQVVTAHNAESVTFEGGQQRTIVTPEVAVFEHDGLGANLNAPIWRWTPLEVTPYTTTLDDIDALPNSANWINDTITNHHGAGYLTNLITNTAPPPYDAVVYSPTLQDGDYLVQVYCGGDSGAEQFGHQTMVYIQEGANPLQGFPVDQSVAGWVTISNTRFQHRGSVGADLKVFISNYSPLAADAGRKAYADEVRFIGSFNTSIDATPVQTKAFITPQGGGAPVERDVVVVAANDGHVYCLDAVGNGNGTTNVLWAYPSIEPTGTPDPNAALTEDGDGANVVTTSLADGFGTSTPVVQRIGGVDYCFVAARNGRVYCLNMAGRGDYNAAAGTPGTTSRNWTYPNDIHLDPAHLINRQLPIAGGFGGSVAYGEPASGPTIYVPAMEGRVYALNAIGDPLTKTTSTRWTYPQRTSQNLGAVTTTPTVDFGRLYFGTSRLNDFVPGQFYALDWNTGNVQWVFEGDPNTALADNFRGGPATATAAQLGGANPADTVFCSNDNLYVYALKADDGTLLWQTPELNAPVTAPLMFQWLTVPDITGTATPFPLVMVPTDDGRFEALFARVPDVNVNGDRMAWGYYAGSDSIQASIANGWNFMYGADMSGNLYAWGNGAGVGGMGRGPGAPAIPPNDNSAPVQQFRNAKIALITKLGYNLLRLSDAADINGDTATIPYDQFIDTGTGLPFDTAPRRYLRTAQAFEWGETAYLCVYDFPWLDKDGNNNPISPPVVEFQIGVQGASVRSYGVQAKKFNTAGPFGDGYAILAFPIQGSGPTSIPPGGATVRFSLRTAATNNNGQVTNIPADAARAIQVANPIGVYMPNPGNGAIGGAGLNFGTNVDPTNPERLVNGSPNMPNGGIQGSRLGQTEGVVANGQTGIGNIWVVDMSMLTLLKGPGRGLEGVRLTRPDLSWLGGPGAVVKPLDPFLYPNLEDLPSNFPNNSIDYPNIDRENLRATKDPTGVPENLFVSPTGVALNPPNPYDENNILNRITHPMLVELDADIPRFQPANNDRSRDFVDTLNNRLPSGYAARLNVFVDSDGNGHLNNVSGRREAYRSFWTNVAVALDDRIAVETPTVDLGTLAAGSGYSPFAPGTNNGTSFSPWDSTVAVNYNGAITTNNPDFLSMWQPLKIVNLGNVNDWNIRLAKSVVGGTGAIAGDWPIYSNSVDDLGWLDTANYVFTNFDKMYGMTAQMALPKARVGDQLPTEFSTNPRRRLNQNLGVLDGYLMPNGPIGDAAAPRIAVAPPIGFPVGQFSQQMQIIEDTRPWTAFLKGNEAVDLNINDRSLEVLSSPAFELKFQLRETRATSGFTPKTAPMIDYPQNPANQQNLTWSNLQPGAMRLPNGAVVVAYTSSQGGFNSPLPTSPVTDPQYHLFISTLQGTTPASPGGNPTNELGAWTPAANDRWFHQEVGPFPAPVNYPTIFGGATLAGTEKFGAPSFPGTGLANPIGGANFTQSKMAFIGVAQKQNGGVRDTESRLLTADVTVTPAGAVTVNNLLSMPFDPNTPKSRPTLYQISNNAAAIFYSASGTGDGQIYYTVTDGTNFTQPALFNVGNGFEQVGSPSVQLRRYQDNGVPFVEISFIGKLRGRPNSEVFYGRAQTTTVSVNGNNVANAPGSPLYLPSRLKEPMSPDSEPGTFRASGVVWSTRLPIHVYQRLNGADTDLEKPGTRTTDRTTGLIRFDTFLGGVAFVDPNLGTVRFANNQPLRTATILLDYTPRFQRISESNVAGHATPTVLWDNRIAGDVSNTSYWFNIAGGGTLVNVPPTALPLSARYVFTYTRAASGAGQAARPYWKSLRLGIQLPSPIYTDSNGNIVNLTIAGANGPVQVDPANGRIYFQASQEDANVAVTYTGVQEGTGIPVLIPSPVGGYHITLVTERAETVVPIDQAVNESGIVPFLDPFDNSPRRPGLIWMFFTSTRAGSPDLYFQTMAPRFTPVVKKG